MFEFVSNIADSVKSVFGNDNKRETSSEINKDDILSSIFETCKAENYKNDLSELFNTDNECTDGKDDGHIGFLEGAKSFFTGVGNKIKEQVSGLVNTVKEHPIKTLLTVGAITAACVLGGPVVIAGVSLIGVATAAVGVTKAVIGIAKGVKAADDATTDKEKREALENIGGSTLEATENIVIGVASAASAAKAIQAVRATSGAAAASGIDDAARAGSDSIDDAARTSADSLDDAARAGSDSIDDAARASQKRIELLNKKYQNGQLTEQQWQNLVDDEYMKLR